MATLPDKAHIVSGDATEALFQGAMSDLYDVIAQLGLIGPSQELALDPTGAVAPSHCNVIVDTENLSATDDLNLIAPTDIGEQIIFLRSKSSARIVTLKHMASGTGRLYLQGLGDVVLRSPQYCIALMWNASATRWEEMWRSWAHVPAEEVATIQSALGLGTAATRDVGISNGQIPLKENFGSAAFVNTGLNTGQVPLANQLGALAFKSTITDAELSGTGVSPGTYGAVVVNSQGRVTAGVPVSAPVTRIYTSSTSWTKPSNLAYAEIFVIAAGGGGGSSQNAGGQGGTSTFGSHASAVGGFGGGAAANPGGAGGYGTIGDVLMSGQAGETTITDVGGSTTNRDGGQAAGYGQLHALSKYAGARTTGASNGNNYGAGGASSGPNPDRGSGGGGGGAAYSYRTASELSATETVTVGAAGVRGNHSVDLHGFAGAQGVVIVREYY